MTDRIAAALRRIGIAASVLAAVSCGGESVQIDVRHPPPIFQWLSRIVPSEPITADEIVAPCAADGRIRAMTVPPCVVTIKESTSLIRKAHIYVISGGAAVLLYTPAGGGDTLHMKTTPKDAAHIPIRKAGGTLMITCVQCVLELRAE